LGNQKQGSSKKNGKATFNDVAGLDEAKNEIKEIVDFLKNPKKYQKMGARIPKGVLLVGPSGTGKTLMARAIAGEAKVPFLHMAGSEFMEMLVGIGASRVRDLFENARKAQKAIIFIDELDAIGGVRGMGGFAGSHGEREQTLNQLLVEMDGLEPNETIIILAATNRPDILDPALTRPGRFDRRIVFNLPDLEERTAILKLHSEGKPFAEDVSFKDIARRTVGFSGADLENMLNEAAILAARNNKEKIGPEELDEAAIKVKLGPQKKRMVSEEEKKISAYHEAGHAVVSHFSPEADPVEKISVVARGIALGYTLMPPEKDRVHESKTRLLSRITTLMGGRAAEEMIFDEMTSGAAKDIEHATKIARKMVVEYGMSGLGPLYFGRQMDTTEWGSAYMEPDEVSPQTKANVDDEIKKFVNQSYQNAKDILKKQKKSLDAVADELMTKETLNRKEFEDIIKKATSSQN
jgi:cell division protease FtsH